MFQVSMSDHIWWFAIDISWVTFGGLEVSGHGALYLLVCTENYFFCHRMKHSFNGNKSELSLLCRGQRDFLD